VRYFRSYYPKKQSTQNGAVVKSQQIYIAAANRNGDDQEQELQLFTKKNKSHASYGDK
jgi:hypothetical protein